MHLFMISNLLDRMKLPFRKNKEFLTALHDILGFYPHNIDIYRIAFSHKSISHQPATAPAPPKMRKGRPMRQRGEQPVRPLNNERLEFLGDAVLETVVSDLLYNHFGNRREGFLTATRSKIVQRETLNQLADQMGITQLVQAAQGTALTHTNIGGNAFEALMGAIYLDRGFKFCHWFIAQRVIGPYIDMDNMAHKEVNFKSKLLEWSQKNRININYRDTSHKSEGKGFDTVVVIEGIIVGRGEGRSKKESQQEASKEALTRMRRDPKFYDSLFRSKEKRTAMEAEESFALPKIEEIENEVGTAVPRQSGKKKPAAPVLEKQVSDTAYDTAYDAEADYEVIDQAEEGPKLTAADYAAKGIPAPPDEDDLHEPEEKPKNTRRKQKASTAEKARKPQASGQTDRTQDNKRASAPTTEAKHPADEPDAPKSKGKASPSASQPRNRNAATPNKRKASAPSEQMEEEATSRSQTAAPSESSNRPSQRTRRTPSMVVVKDIEPITGITEEAEVQAAPAAPSAKPAHPASSEAPAATVAANKTSKPSEETPQPSAEAATEHKDATPRPAKVSKRTKKSTEAEADVQSTPQASENTEATATKQPRAKRSPSKRQMEVTPAPQPAAVTEEPTAQPQTAKDTSPIVSQEADNLPNAADVPESSVPPTSFETEAETAQPASSGSSDMPLPTDEQQADSREMPVSPAQNPVKKEKVQPTPRHISLEDFVLELDTQKEAPAPTEDADSTVSDAAPATAEKPQRNKRKPSVEVPREYSGEEPAETNGEPLTETPVRKKSHRKPKSNGQKPAAAHADSEAAPAAPETAEATVSLPPSETPGNDGYDRTEA